MAKKSIPSINTSTPSRNAPTFAGVIGLGEDAEPQLGVDRPRLLGHDLGLAPAQAAGRGAELAVEVGQLEAVGVGDVERPDAQTGQGDQVDPPDPPHSDDRHPALAEPLLLLAVNKAPVARERLLIREGLLDQTRARGASLGLVSFLAHVIASLPPSLILTCTRGCTGNSSSPSRAIKTSWK